MTLLTAYVSVIQPWQYKEVIINKRATHFWGMSVFLLRALAYKGVPTFCETMALLAVSTVLDPYFDSFTVFDG